MDFDYILVLGGPLNGDKPSPLLLERIKTAAQFYKEHGGVKIIVSGGIKGKNQQYSEAAVMKNALCELGVRQEDIILEDKAKTTLENFLYTKELVEQGAKVTYVTNKFHIHRSTLILERAGVDYVPMSAPDGEHSLSFRVRERFLLPLAKLGLIK